MTGPGARWIGPLCSVLGVLGFSFKAILVKLAYAWHPVDAGDAARAADALRGAVLRRDGLVGGSAGRDDAPITTRDWRALVWLGFIGYYLSSLLDFIGLHVHHRRARAARAAPVSDDGAWCSRPLLHGRRVTRREVAALALSYAGIALVFAHDLSFGGDARALWIGGALVFASAMTVRGVPDRRRRRSIARLGSMRFIAWAMLCVVRVRASAQFALTRDLSALAVPRSIMRCRSRWRCFRRSCRRGSSPRRSEGLGANTYPR